MTAFAYLTEGYVKDRASCSRELYEEYSFQACPYDTANPAFYIKTRTSYKAWGKNLQKND